jgi:predicted regulator of Ras-like GTPase activity (Roadblock/LC7/MglB family)
MSVASSLDRNIRQNISDVLKEEEENTDLENLSVLSRVGMKVSSADSVELNADAISASSTALIDLGLRLSESTHHGALREIVLHNESGYSILMAINDDYMVFGGLTATYRIGYYLSYLRELARKINQLISGDTEAEMALSLEEEELEKIRQKEEEEEEKKEEVMEAPSVEKDKEALEGLLGFLDDWEKEGLEPEELQTQNEQNIVSIPETSPHSKPTATQASTTEATEAVETAEPTAPTESEFHVYDDEIPPVPIEDYTPMEVEEGEPPQETASEPEPELEPEPSQVAEPPLEAESTEVAAPQLGGESTETTATEGTKPEPFPSFDDVEEPDFDSEIASEYDTDSLLDEESEELDSVLKDLGWDEEED